MQGQKTGGRQIGAPNKVTAIFKDAVRTVYEDIGGHAAFAAWAKENPTEFYRIAALVKLNLIAMILLWGNSGVT